MVKERDKEDKPRNFLLSLFATSFTQTNREVRTTYLAVLKKIVKSELHNFEQS